MAITIIKQPDNFKPAMVRNPIEIGMETDKYLMPTGGRKAHYRTSFADIEDMIVGAGFTVEINGGAITEAITISATPSGTNEILPRSDFAAGVPGGNAYMDHIAGILNAHPTISTKFAVTNSPAVGFNIDFISLINEPVTVAVTKFIDDTYTLTHTTEETGLYDNLESVANGMLLQINLVAEGNPVADDEIVMEIDGTEYTFVFKTSPDESGYQLPLIGALSTADYQQLVLTKLLAAPCFFENWVIETETIFGEILYLFAAYNHIGTVISTNNTGRYTFTNLPGYDAQYQPNFTNNLVLYCEEIYNSNDFKKIVELYAFPIKFTEIIDDVPVDKYQSFFRIDKLLYDYMLKIYTQNLAEALPYVANFPNANHLLKKFKFRYFENYGNPATAKITGDAGPFFGALYGAGHLAFIDRKKLDAYGLLHPGQTSDNPFSIKQYVDKDLPAWLYFYIQRSDGNDLGNIDRVYYKAYFDDGTDTASDIADAALFSVTVNSTKAFFVKAGYTQLDLAALNTLSKYVYKWEVIVSIDEEYTFSKTFVLDCCASYKTTLMYQNSYGGYDTVTITAPKEFSLELTDGKEVERILPSDYLKHDSQFEATIPKARQNIKCNIGYKKSSDFDILKELLISKFVFVLPKNTTDVFYPVNIDRKTINLESEDEFEKNFSFEFSPAHEFKNFENNLWLK